MYTTNGTQDPKTGYWFQATPEGIHVTGAFVHALSSLTNAAAASYLVRTSTTTRG